ncbi:uncharacterized protein LOC117176444 [Belonocnema kinseyi]|uniref:uncharacterized protein LOC117176444 n=1 Tax=Belonocnema kinseyi TaxID=2817044 RepID=UPI00143CDB36|nr:uncharacterized protein LOC117176444 [Belonocnema kinseyi]
MISILQGNLHRSRTADDLLTHLVYEKKADLLLLCDQYQDREVPTWFADSTGTAAISVRNGDKVPVDDHGFGAEFDWIRSRRTTFVSVYLTPNKLIKDFEVKLEGLEEALQDMAGGIVIPGDFNAEAVKWGMPKSNPRGKRIMEMAARRGLIVLNTGASTFRRTGQRETTPDVSFASENMAGNFVN